MRALIGLVVLAAVVALALSCGGASGAAASANGASGLEGRALYVKNCAACHGADLKGTPTGPSFLNDVYRPGHHADAAFLFAVRNGTPQHHWNFGPMLPVRGVSDRQVQAIVAYVRAQQAAAGLR